MLKNYSILKNINENSKAFIVSSGLSINDIINDKNYNSIFDSVVIAINSSIISVPWMLGNDDKRYWISCDCSVRDWDFFDRVKKSFCKKLIKKESWEPYFQLIPDFYQFSNRSSYNLDDGLDGTSSGPSAIDLAIQLGCNFIYLLGFDGFSIGKKTHYWEEWVSNKQPKYKNRNTSQLSGSWLSSQEKIFDKNILSYQELNKIAISKNVKIYNCSLKSKINIFEKIDFDKIFRKI